MDIDPLEAIDKKDRDSQQEEDRKTYDALNFHDDRFDLADAAVSIAISLLAVTALTNKFWLYLIALLPTGFGLAMGLAGLFNLGIHPDALTKLLSQNVSSPIFILVSESKTIVFRSV